MADTKIKSVTTAGKRTKTSSKNTKPKNATAPVASKESEAKVKPSTEAQAAPSPRVLNEEVIREHLMIRRSINITYIAELSRLFCENAQMFLNAFLGIFEESEAKELADKIISKKIEVTTYETIEALTAAHSPLIKQNKQLYNILKDISRKAEGCDDEDIPAEAVYLEEYADQPIYLVIREAAYVYAIDAYINDFRKNVPNCIAFLSSDREDPNNVVSNLLLLHISAWIPEMDKCEFVTNEKIGEFLSAVRETLTAIASGAIITTNMNITSNPNTDLFQIIQNTGNPNYTIQTFYSFNGIAILQVIDDTLVVDKSGESIEELLADDGMEEDDVTLMDVIDQEEPKKAKDTSSKEPDKIPVQRPKKIK